MLKWAAIFLVIGLIAAVLGFGGIAGAAIDIAKALFWIFIAIAAVFIILGLVAKNKLTGR